jgi:glycosyltransferase involved in cell wall biosynthesis
MISIIIPTYNSEAVLTSCLDSISHQSYPFVELIIVDGNSTDSTLSIAKRYSSNYKNVRWISESDKGIYDAMNKGIALAKGEWIYFLGSDDKLADNNVLEKVARATSNNQCELIYGNVKMVGDASWAENGAIYDGPFTVDKLFIKNICHQAVFYKREVFKRLGVFNIEYKVCADWDFNHRCFANFNTCYVDLVIAYFFAGGQSTNVSSDKFTNEDFVINLSKYYQIGYGNKIFKNSLPVFFNLAKSRLKSRQLISSFYFLLVSLIHTNHRIGLIKNYVVCFFSSKSTN